jgi:hypothetical protein
MLAALAVCLSACASNSTNSSGSTAENASESEEKVCHWETGSRFGSKDRRVCRTVDES